MTHKNINIRINNDRCIKCGKCARVCPTNVIYQEKKGSNIGVKNIDSCIVCSHCVDVCPTESVQHSQFPLEKTHTIDYSKLPTPEQVMLLIKSRRSNRALTSKPIPEQVLQQIVEAAYYAPTASNNQQVSVTVITDTEILRQIGNLTMKALESRIKKLNFPLIKWVLKPFLKKIYTLIPAFYRYKQQHLAGEDPILRKATVLVIFHTPPSNEFGSQDANLAYQNASLMAQALDISQIYMGFVMQAIKQDSHKVFARMLGIDEKIQAIMALGIPAFKYKKYTDRKIPIIGL